jgi:hypothetical protein
MTPPTLFFVKRRARGRISLHGFASASMRSNKNRSGHASNEMRSVQIFDLNPPGI